MTREEYEEYLEENIAGINFYEKKMLDNDTKYCRISDLAKRFIEVDKIYAGQPWNLEQILANIRMTEYYTKEEIITEGMENDYNGI